MNSPEKIRQQNPSKAPRVGIVGAGIAGLRCADILLQYGFQVTILEARDRIGGRVHHFKLPSGQIIDLGPNWVHGTEHNPILELAKETNTPLHSWEGRSNIFGEDGKILPDGDHLSDKMWGIIVQAFKYSAEHTSTIDPGRSLHDFFVEKVAEAFPDEKGQEYQRKIVMQMSELWGGFVGSPVTKQSLKFFWLEECVNGENLFCAGTFQNILPHIAKPALQNADIKLSTKVVRIETKGDGIRLSTDDDIQFEYDEVVVTAPLGWLKNNKDAFSPALPARFIDAIDGVDYGCLEKVFITFPSAFWLEDNTVPADQPFTGFTQWLSPAYSSGTNPQRWYQESVDLSTLPGSCSHPTLLFYIFGEQSVALSKELKDRPSQKEKEEYITRFFKPYYSLLPHFVEDSRDCIPVSCVATSWATDEFAGYGSYSTFRTGLKAVDKDIEILREGLHRRSLWFAGEHNGPFIAMGTVTSAYWSGEAVGKRIAAAYGKLRPDPDHEDEAVETASSDGSKEVNIRGFGDKALEK